MVNRAVDYFRFAVGVVGLGYLLLWPLTTPHPFGISRFCRPQAESWPGEWLCHWPQLVRLSPGLHLIGLSCAGALAIHVALRQAARWRRARELRTGVTAALGARRLPGTISRPPRQSAFAKPLPKVKPRSQFGLRVGPRTTRHSGVSSPSKARMPVEQD